MPASFIRRFLSDPGLETLLEIESVNILDLEPPAALTGVGSGTALLVAEFENGPFATEEGPQEVGSSTDFLTRFGGFGYIYDSVPSNNPCARVRRADSAIIPEFWNGNGFIALVNKRFKRLVVARVDTSVGAVEFTRLPCLSGSTSPTFDLSPAQTLVLVTDSGSTTFTFNATAAHIDSAAGAYPGVTAGGEQMVVAIDGTLYTVVFAASASLTQANVIDRINAVVGYTAATNQGGGVTRITGRTKGTSGSVQIVSIDAALAAITGFAAGSPAIGTGNVSNIATVTLSELATILGASWQVQRDADGAVAICSATAAFFYVGSTSTAAGLGFTSGFVATANGTALLAGRSGTFPTTFAGGETLVLSHDGGQQLVITFTSSEQTAAQVASFINAAVSYTMATVVGGQIMLASKNAGPSARVDVYGGTGATTIGFAGPYIQSATSNVVGGTLPAGTRVRNSSGNEWVTMQGVTVTAASKGPYSVKVRPAQDDGTAASALAFAVNVMPFHSPIGGFNVVNPLPLSAALTEAQLDAAYQKAFDTTLNLNSTAAIANLSWSARQSNACRAMAKQNALVASANGAFGRLAFIRPPLGTTTRARARGSVQPGVGAYRDQRAVYCYPGVQTFVSQIAARGLSGGDGFTADGVIDVPFDGFVASVCSLLPPEENPGQETTFLGGVLGIEAGNPDVQNLDIGDYTAFRASGICAPRIDGTAFIQSGVTSVDPSVSPNLRNIARRRMADFIQDSLARRLSSFGKKLNARSRRAVIKSEIDAFMRRLKDGERIDGFKTDSVSGNTPDTLALGVFRIILRARTLSSLDSIVLVSTIGENVDIAEAA